MVRREFRDGRTDGLVPLRSLDLQQIHSFEQLLQAMSHTAFSGRQLGIALEVLGEMAQNPQCAMVLTLSGAMTVAKQGRILCELIDRGLVAAIVATGALVAHGLTESMGLTHYRYDPTLTDEELFQKGYNRVYDTLEMEANLNDVERLISDVLSSRVPPDGMWSSARLCRAFGERLSQMDEGPGILRSAFERQVPVFIPAFTDSEMGLDVSIWAMLATVTAVRDRGCEPSALSAGEILAAVPPFNPFLDLQEYGRLVHRATTLGIFTIGGGVPRNWAQQVAPYMEVVNHRLGTRLKLPRFQYGVRICPEPVHWGGLSGCTYSEGVSWGKFVPPSEGGRYAEVYADATLVLPVLVKALWERLSTSGEEP